jgi:Transposase DDE domain
MSEPQKPLSRKEAGPMIVGTKPSGKLDWESFQSPPWSSQSPAWLELDEDLEEDHLARLIDWGVDQLDLQPLVASFGRGGSKPYRPDLMLKIVLFEIQRGRSSPAQWFLDARENKVLHWLGLGIRPVRSVWYQFAFRIQRWLDDWNKAILAFAQKQLGRPLGRRSSLDGTAVEANASRHHLLNREQVQQREQLLRAATIDDTAGRAIDKRPYWMAKQPHTRLRQLQQYTTARAKLEEQWEENQRRIPSKRREENSLRISIADPDAFLGKDKYHVFRPMYNVQYMRDVDSPFIVAYETFSRGSDAGTLVPLIKRLQQLTGHKSKEVLVDSGYVTGVDLADANRLKVQLYGPWKENDFSRKASTASQHLGKDQFIWDESLQTYRCPAGKLLRRKGVQNRQRSLGRQERVENYCSDPKECADCPLKAKCCPQSKSGRNLNRSEHESLIEAHRRKMEQPEAKTTYKLRRQTVEPAFGDGKEHRGLRRIRGRGLLRAKIQVALTVLSHNIRQLANFVLGAGPEKNET